MKWKIDFYLCVCVFFNCHTFWCSSLEKKKKIKISKFCQKKMKKKEVICSFHTNADFPLKRIWNVWVYWNATLSTLESNGKIAWWDLWTLFETRIVIITIAIIFAEYCCISFAVLLWFDDSVTIAECVMGPFFTQSKPSIYHKFERLLANFYIFIYVKKKKN